MRGSGDPPSTSRRSVSRRRSRRRSANLRCGIAKWAGRIPGDALCSARSGGSRRDTDTHGFSASSRACRERLVRALRHLFETAASRRSYRPRTKRPFRATASPCPALSRRSSPRSDRISRASAASMKDCSSRCRSVAVSIKFAMERRSASRRHGRPRTPCRPGGWSRFWACIHSEAKYIRMNFQNRGLLTTRIVVSSEGGPSPTCRRQSARSASTMESGGRRHRLVDSRTVRGRSKP